MTKASRQQRILEYLNVHQTVDIEELSKLCNVSTTTIRRDLSDLTDAGDIERVHGGAVIKDLQVEPFVLPRANFHYEQKRRIGKAAAELVNDGDTIIISTGTTTEAMIPFLSEKNGLTVITNALNIAYKLSFYQHITTIVLGGILRHQEYDLLGHITENSLSGLVASKLYRGVMGIDVKHGFTATDITHVRTDEKLIEVVQEMIIVADHSKFRQIGSISLAPITAAAAIITDNEAPQDVIQEIRDAGVKVIAV
ncbi:MAG: DeoR family transcriptional regulator, aga operon transcriptional repressor [Chloroflexota bacterium]|nr:DeoR family transcriptional regulator, aga operon transcriptional repressor [Chloroflexota bacterium]